MSAGLLPSTLDLPRPETSTPDRPPGRAQDAAVAAVSRPEIGRCYTGAIMVRTQIQLAEDQHLRLTRYAGRLGISLAEAVRRCVDAQLDREMTAPSRDDRVRAALAVCGKYHDPQGDTDVARNHDRQLGEAYGS